MWLGVITPGWPLTPREEMAQPSPLSRKADELLSPTASPHLATVPSDLLQAALLWPPVSYPATMATTLCSPEHHGNRIPLPTVLWQSLSTTHNTGQPH